MKAKLVLVLLALIFTLGACDLFAGVGSDDIDQGTSTAEEIGSTSSLVPGATNTDRQQDDPGTDLVGESTAASSASDEITTTPQASPAPFPEEWMREPVVPVVSERAVEIYQQGLEMGKDPQAFSKIGDCQNITDYFFSSYENPSSYTLGEEFAYLAPTVEHFQGSFGRESLAVEGGMNVAAVLSPLRADPAYCGGKYSPVVCELLNHRPSIAIISFEEWWGEKSAETYEGYLRQVVEQTIAQGVVPILVTKADNLEGDHSINQVIVKLANEYQIPLWNFWRAVQDIPNGGLREDGFHLTYKKHCNHFDRPECLEYAWTWRNLSGLQVLHAVWQGVSQQAGAE